MRIITASQCRAARGLLNWSQPHLAKLCGLHKQTISNFEAERSTPSRSSLEKIASALENGGVEFTDDEGVKNAEEVIQLYRGQAGFQKFMTDVYETCRDIGGDVYISNADELLFDKWMGEEFEATYAKNMRALPKGSFWFHAIACEDATYLPVPHGEYRWIPKEFFSPFPTYIYGNKLALIAFLKDDVIVRVYKQKAFIDSQIKLFLFMWNYAQKFKNPPKPK